MSASATGGIAMGAELYCIPAHEDAALDRSRIGVLRQSLGDQRCREVVSEVVFHLTDRLGLLQTALAEGKIGEAQALAARLASLSAQVGLPDFSRVARDLAGCLAIGDGTAIAAVSSRLERLGEDSLISVIVYIDGPTQA
jgi:NADPH-dependent ferric siderophore reductase